MPSEASRSMEEKNRNPAENKLERKFQPFEGGNENAQVHVIEVSRPVRQPHYYPPMAVHPMTMALIGGLGGALLILLIIIIALMSWRNQNCDNS
jgi:hypothetical protein